MKPTNSSTAATGGFQRNSPIPYLFGGIAVVLGLITLALLFIACSSCKSSASSSRDHLKKSTEPSSDTPVSSEPKIVVIMAGDDNPTYLARPVSSRSQGEQVSAGP